MINGIQGYSNLYNTQAIYNQYRLNNVSQNRNTRSSAVTPVPAIPSHKQNTEMSDSMDYLKEYSSSMTDLMSSANSLRDANTGSVYHQQETIPSDTAILDASGGGRLTSGASYDVAIDQLAKSQVNVSDALNSNSMAEGDLNMQLSAGDRNVNIQIPSSDSKGIQKTNRQVLSEAAASVNKAGAGVKASVVTKEGESSLQLESVKPGAGNRFTVSGDFAENGGMDTVTQPAQNASYSVTANGSSETYTSESNEVSIDNENINITLKKEGSASVNVTSDPQKVVSAMEDLVSSFNDTAALLAKNLDRGSGNASQLTSMLNNVTGSKESMEKLGLSSNKDGTLSLDKEKLTESLKEEPSLAKDLISGSSGFAQKAFSSAKSGSSASAASIVGNDVAQDNNQRDYDDYNTMSSLSRRGGYNMTNYNTVGLLFNMCV